MISRLRGTTLVVIFVLTIAAVTAASPVRAAEGAPTTGALIALDARTGGEIWQTSTPAILSIDDVSKRAVAGRTYGCHGGPFRTVAYRATDGKHLWQAPAGGSIPSNLGGSTLATGSTRSGVTVSTTATEVRGLDAVSGRERWSVGVAHAPRVAIDASTVVIAEPGAELRGRVRGVARAFDRATGEQRWSVSVADADLATAVVGPGSVAVAFTRQVLFAVDVTFPTDARVLAPRSGTERWSTDLAPTLVTDSVVALNQAPRGYATGLIVVDAATGDRLWERLPVDRMWSMGARLGIQDAAGFRVVDARTGATIWDRPTGTGRAIAAGRSAVALVDGATLTLVDASTGAPRWQSAPLVAGAESFNSVALAGERVYVAVGCSLSD